MAVSMAWLSPTASVLLTAGLLSWSSAAAAQVVASPAAAGPESVVTAPAKAAPSEATYGGPRLTSDVQADHAFKLQAEALKFADEKAWDKARDKLIEAWQYGEFPNVAFHLAAVYDALNEPELASEQLGKFLSLAEPSNVNYVAAVTLQAKLRKPEAAWHPPPAPAPGPQDLTRGSAPVASVVLAASGAAMLFAALTTGLLANAAEGELERNCPQNRCDPKLQGVADRGRTLKLVTNTLLVTGGAALGAGAAWWVSMACSSAHGCSAALSGRF